MSRVKRRAKKARRVREKFPLSETKERPAVEIPKVMVDKRVWAGRSYRTEKVPVHPRDTLHGEAEGLPYQAYYPSVEQKSRSILRKIHHAKREESKRQASRFGVRFTPEKFKISMPKEKPMPSEDRFGGILKTGGYKMTAVSPNRMEKRASHPRYPKEYGPWGQSVGPYVGESGSTPEYLERKKIIDYDESPRKQFRSLERAKEREKPLYRRQWDPDPKYTGWKYDPIEHAAAKHARDREKWIKKSKMSTHMRRAIALGFQR